MIMFNLAPRAHRGVLKPSANGTASETRILSYGGCPGGVTGLSIRYQGELLGLWDPQNRDLRRKLPPETMFSVG